MSVGLALAAYGLTLATLGPRLLRGATWPERSPGLGILAWLALTVSVSLSAVFAGLAVGMPKVRLGPDLATLLRECAAALQARYSTGGGALVSTAGVLLAAGVLARGGYFLITGLRTASRLRRRHARDLALTGRRRSECGGAVIVDHPDPAAYCLPGRCRQVVLTSAAVAVLDRPELEAVLAHERAHLRGRHDLVVGVAVALARAFPYVRVFRDAAEALARLVEMRADDVAARRRDRLTVARAMVRLAEGPAPTATLRAAGGSVLARVRRLAAPVEPLGPLRAALTVLALTVVLVTPATLATTLPVGAGSDCPVQVA